MLEDLFGRILFAPETEEGAAPEEELELEEGTESEEGEEQEESEEGDEGVDLEEGKNAESKPSRKETRVQKLANEARTEREARIRLEERLAEQERTRTAQPSGNQDAERQRAERMALMTSEEKTQFLLSEKADRLEQRLEFQNIQMGDFRDEAKYDAVATLDNAKGRAYAKHKDWVEQELMNARKKGQNPSRELLIRIKLGDDALNAKPAKKLGKDKEAASNRVASSKSTPTSIRGGADMGKGKGDSLADLRARILSREARGEAG